MSTGHARRCRRGGSSRGRPASKNCPGPDAFCFLCARPVVSEDFPQEFSEVKHGLHAIRGACVQRGDVAMLILLQSMESAWLHRECRADYTHRVLIARAVNSNAVEPSGVEGTVERALRSQAANFNVLTDCFFCGKSANIYKLKKLPLKKRKRTVHCAETEACLQDTIEDWIARRKEALPHDNWADEVLARVNQLLMDLPAAEAKYHKHCTARFFSYKLKPESNKPGRRRGAADAKKQGVFLELCKYIEESGECQFSLTELEKFMSDRCDESYSRKHLKRKLSDHYGSAITITERSGWPGIVNFTGFAHNLLYNNWYKEKRKNDEEEKKRVLKLAADLLLESMRNFVTDMDTYPTEDEILDFSLPNLLDYFLSQLITFKSSRYESRVRAYLGQAIMYACRPRSFLPPFLLGMSAHLHSEYASRELIDLLNSVGAAVSYSEVKRYRYNLFVDAKAHPPQAQEDGDDNHFRQFSFDNSDSEVNTIDGKNTFHCMGGMRFVSPPCYVPSARIPRQPLPFSSATEPFPGQVGIPIRWYTKPRVNGLSAVRVKPLEVLALSNPPPPSVKTGLVLDTVWLLGQFLKAPVAPSWSGYMKQAMRGTEAFTGFISGTEVLPFIDMDPNNDTCINSALIFAANECRRTGQEGCLVTMDQMLYNKAVQIVSSDTSGELSSITMRLGGFHLLLSFLGSIGYIMQGSGLDDLLTLEYGPNTVKKIMSGKNYARACRAHFLAQQTTLTRLLHRVIMQDETKEALMQLHQDFLNNKITAEETAANPAAKQLTASLQEVGEGMARRSKTGKLWWLYCKLVSLLRLFIRAERTADWELHLLCVEAMLPFFHAAAHIHYAKAAHLYLQQMRELTGDTERAVREGHFAVRRKPEPWAGVWTDLATEQGVNRLFKLRGGVTHGRGYSQRVLSEWVMTLPALIRLATLLETHCGIHSATSEHHVDLRPSRQKRDCSTLTIMSEWMEAHDPFDDRVDGIKNIATGELGGDSVNCYDAEEVGRELLRNTYGKMFDAYPRERKRRVTPLAHRPSEPKLPHDVEIDVAVLFMRVCRLGESEEKMREFLSFELAPYPPALFDERGFMRKNTKSKLTKHFGGEDQEGNAGSDANLESLAELHITAVGTSLSAGGRSQSRGIVVVDGGYLLRSTPWPREAATFRDICKCYVKRVKDFGGNNTVVVFDGYRIRWSTKSDEQRRRLAAKGVKPCVNIDPENDGRVTVDQNTFFTNSYNKAALIDLVTVHLRDAGVDVQQADADADVPLAEAAMDMDNGGQSVIVMANDTDVIAILIARARENTAITVRHPGNSLSQARDFPISAIKQRLHEEGMTGCVLLAHALSGADTTSAIYGKGKAALWNILRKDRALRDKAAEFSNPYADRGKIIKCGEELILALYTKPAAKLCPSCTTLDCRRIHEFNKRIKKARTISDVRPADLPPTSDAAAQHSLRTFLQVQQWLGNDMDPLAWGWHNNACDTLRPVPMTKPPAPSDLAKLITCSCDKGNCSPGTNCSCRKAGQPCNILCDSCMGTRCNNNDEDEDNPDEFGWEDL